MAKIKGFLSKTLHSIPHQKCSLFNSSFAKFLTKNNLLHPILILNKNVSENDDNYDDYKFF